MNLNEELVSFLLLRGVQKLRHFDLLVLDSVAPINLVKFIC